MARTDEIIHEIIHIVATTLMLREGHVITPALADERARNLAQIFLGLYNITEKEDLPCPTQRAK